jgi:cell division protein FtsI (penicillin-binding protein 3)
VNRWGATSIGSIAIGQEVGVTPLQLVSMVSTIANGGVYLPPRVLMPGQVDGPNNQTLAPPQVAQPFKAGGELPSPLPAGAHRVISTMTSAEMRKMMEGVVLYGTGRSAQLNGYSSGGKTGTAQKIDPATHTYSKTMHIASFVGIAPVNNPVIAVAVVMDNPKGGAYHGADVSAPIFTEVAQQVLEYLSVPHDITLRRPHATANVQVAEDDAHEQTADIHALYDAANDLPSDDPLRDTSQLTLASHPAANPAPSSAAPTNAASGTALAPPSASALPQSTPQTVTQPIILDDGKKLRVPSLIGLPVRKVIEQAAAVGLDVQITGSGTVREQAPAAGTMVAPGTRIVVRCGQ